jgi:electron transport complex protein RnfA
MPNKLALFLTLAVFSGLSMNLILRFGIGLQKIAMEEDSRDSAEKSEWFFLIRTGIIFVSIMLLWLFFSALQSVLFLGFLEYILIFPVSSLFFTALEYLAGRLVLKSEYSFIGRLITGDGQLSFNSMLGGAPAGAALFIMLGLAGGFAEAVTLSFGFSAGGALAVLIVTEVRRRSAMEAVPRFLRGGPLVLVTMGLLSLVVISAATVFYAVLGAN